MKLKKGDSITLNNVCDVEITWCNDELMQVAYKDMTRRLLKIDNYVITKMVEKKLIEIGKWLVSEGYDLDLNDDFWMENEYEIKIRDLINLLNEYEIQKGASGMVLNHKEFRKLIK